MFDLAPRNFDIKSTTGHYIGPNTYEICSSLESRKKNAVPFCSTDTRTPSFIGKKITDALYNISDAPKTPIKGGSSLRNKGERFAYKPDETPCPTKYNARAIRCEKCPKLDPKKPKLYVCSVPHTITDCSAPSIPTKFDENGYDLDDNGNVSKNPPDLPNSSDRPYREPLSSGVLYQGCKWSQRTSRRCEPELKSTPGPAEYFTKLPECRQSQADEEFRKMARLFTFIPRYIEAEELKTIREDLPGPGSYEMIRPATTPCSSTKPKPFISGIERFKTIDSDSPAPDRYKICDCYRKKRYFSMKNVPFGSESSRFKWKQCDDSPGPAFYLVKSPLYEKLRGKKNPYAVVHAPFSQTAPRDISFAPRDAYFTPSPAHYLEETEISRDETEEIHASVFRSTVERFPRTTKKDSLSSASYNVSKIVNRIRSNTSHNVADPPFNSTGFRDTSMGGRFGGPGPADHCDFQPIRPISTCKSYFFNVTPRFKSDGRQTPGPGEYDVDSCERAVVTHNLRLKENAWRKKLRLAPKSTRKGWMEELEKKKFMRWFVKEETVQDKKILRLRKFIEEEEE